MAAWHYIKGRWWIFAIPTVIPALVGAAMIYFHFNATSFPPRPWYESLLTLGIIFIVSPILSLLWVMLKVSRGQHHERELLERGVRCTAILDSVQETGLWTNDVPELEMVLLVDLGGGDPIRVVHREHVSVVNIHKLVPGSGVGVVIDPASPENLMLNI